MMRLPAAAVLAVTAMLMGASAAQAQGQDDDATRKLREESMKERVDALEKKAQDGVSFTNSNGLKFKTGDGNFEGAIGGRFYFVYRHVFERRDTGTTNANSFVVDTARIQLDGTFFKEFYYRIEAEAGKNDDFRIKDSYMGWRGLEGHSFQFGAFKEPFGQEQTTSSRFNDFAERSVLDRLVPAHDIGMMWSTSFADRVVGLELGFFNGNGRQAAAQAENNDEKDICARVRVTPFRSSDNEWLKQLRVGLAFTYGDVDNLALADINGADLSNLTMIDFTGTEDGVRTRIGIEFSWISGPMSVRAEYVTMNREIIVAADREDFDTTAYYLQFTYLLTGETKPLENRVVPKKNFSVKEGNWGAWELAVRLANFDATDGEDVGAVAAGANQEIQEITFGVNWWMTPNVRLMLNYEMFNFDEEVPNGGLPIDDQSIFYTRFQIDF